MGIHSTPVTTPVAPNAIEEVALHTVSVLACPNTVADEFWPYFTGVSIVVVRKLAAKGFFCLIELCCAFCFLGLLMRTLFWRSVNWMFENRFAGPRFVGVIAAAAFVFLTCAEYST